MNANIFPKNFWEIIQSFPNIGGMKDLTKAIEKLEETGEYRNYPEAYYLLKEFEASTRSNIYAEWHAPEFVHEDSTDLDTPY